MKIILVFSILLSAGWCQHHNSLLGDIPAKIHLEIFGSHHLMAPYTFPLNSIPYTTSLLHHPIHFDYKNSFLQNFTTPKIPLATDLFAPAIIKTPAATKGQIEAYEKALAEEAKQELEERLKEQQRQNLQQQHQQGILLHDQGYLIGLESKAVSYVNVKLGGAQNVKYDYQS